MNKKFFLLIISLVLISGCVVSEDIIQQVFKIQAIGGGSEDIIINAEFPKFAKQNREFSWKLEVIPTYDIERFNLKVHETCPLIKLVEGEEDNWEYDDILKERMKILITRYKVIDDIPFEQECRIKFMATYDSTVKITQSISVLEIVEYEQRETDETLNEIETYTSKTENPLDIKISFSKEQPFIEEADVYMYIDYDNNGDGFIDTLEDVTIIYPNNLKIIECDDYSVYAEKNELELNEPLKFFKNKAKRSTCKFETIANQVIDTGTIELESTYEYKIYGEVAKDGKGIEIRK